MAEYVGNIGYMAVGKETTPGVAVTPTFYVPLYEESLETNANFQKLGPIAGHKFATNQTIAGFRSHGGEVTVLGEANIAAHLANMLLTKGATSGANPYTTTFSVSTTNPGTYTIDIFTGNNVQRFCGVQAGEISPDFNDNEIRLKASLVALKSFQGRKIASIATNTITLATDYDQSPSTGLVVGDLVRLSKEGSATVLDTTVSSINANGTDVTLAASAASFAAGDMITLRGSTPTYNNLEPFTWDKTVVGFGATASAALSNATFALQTRVEQGSSWTVTHSFEKDEGSARSGGRDPAVHIRTLADAELNIKKVFDTPEEIRRFNSLEKVACVVRHYAGSTNQYELRVTFNHLKVDKPVPNLKAGEVNYAEINYIVNQDATDGAAVSLVVTNALAGTVL
jgi:hypothetical protein